MTESSGAKMNNTVRIDAHAFGRGVDEVLQLKPVRRAIGVIIHGHRASKEDISSECHRRRSSSSVTIVREPKHDEPA